VDDIGVVGRWQGRRGGGGEAVGGCSGIHRLGGEQWGAFDHGKPEPAIFRRKKTSPTVIVRVGANPGMATISKGAQAAIRRMASEEPGPSQMYALQARKHWRDLVVPGAQECPGKREGGRVGQACGGGAGRPRGGMARILGPDGSTRDATPQIPRAPQARDLRGSGRKRANGLEAGRPGRSIRYQAGGGLWNGCGCLQEARFEVLLAEDRSLPHRAVPELDEEPTHRSVPAVFVRDADAGPLVQGLPRVETPAEDPVGRGVEEDGEGEELVHDPGPLR